MWYACKGVDQGNGQLADVEKKCHGRRIFGLHVIGEGELLIRSAEIDLLGGERAIS